VAQMAGYTEHKLPDIGKIYNIVKTIIILGYLRLNDSIKIKDLIVYRQYKEKIRKSRYDSRYSTII